MKKTIKRNILYTITVLCLCIMNVFYNLYNNRKQLIKETQPCMNEKVIDFIVTGGAGFIGSHLVRRIRRERPYASILVIDDLSRGNIENIKDIFDIQLIRADLRDPLVSSRHICHAITVYHLADVVAGINYIFNHQAKVFHDNVLINTNVLHACEAAGIQNYIYVGTACSYPKTLQMTYDTVILNEQQTYPALPESAYGWSKLMGEYEAELVASEGSMNVSIIRLHNIYGPNMVYEGSGAQVIPALIYNALKCTKTQQFSVWGSGDQYRDFVFIDDVVDGLLAALERGRGKGLIQLSTGKAVTIRELASMVLILARETLGLTPNECQLKFDTTAMEGDRGRVGDNSKALHELGWSPRVNFTEGLVRTFLSVLHRLPNMAQYTPDPERLTAALLNQYGAPETLVILIGQGRGGEHAWGSLKRNVLYHLHADLATYFTKDSQSETLKRMARYSWELPEYEDWGVAMDQMAASCGADWRSSLCKVPGIMLGGVQGCGDAGRGSGGILLAFRDAVLQKLTELRLWEKYKYFILTRADHVYLCPHPKPSSLDMNSIWIPEGEDYGGITDRHLVAASHLFRKAIDFKQEVLCNPEVWTKRLMEKYQDLNLEMLLMSMWEAQGLSTKRFPRNMFAVRVTGDPTRWSQGDFREDLSQFNGMLVKYAEELDQSEATCGIRAVETIPSFVMS